MKEDIVSFETAKLAKEAGFDWETHKWYYHTFGLNGKKDSSTMGEDFLFNHSIRGKLYYSAPTQALLQKWLREKYDSDVLVDLHPHKPYRAYQHNRKGDENNIYDTYEEALERGLQEDLKRKKQ